MIDGISVLSYIYSEEAKMSVEAAKEAHLKRRDDRERLWVSVYAEYCQMADALDVAAERMPKGQEGFHRYVDAMARGDFQLAECIAYINIREEPFDLPWRDRFGVARCARAKQASEAPGGNGDE